MNQAYRRLARHLPSAKYTRGLRIHSILMAWVMVCGVSVELLGQSARVSGFVTDASTSEPMEAVNVVLFREGVFITGAAANRDGLYILAGLEPGPYVLQASFIGYATHIDTLDLAVGEIRTLSIALREDESSLGELVVQSERTSGAARVTAGLQTVTPEDIKLIPTLDASGDLVGYLYTLPGVVSTGDRGGQLFIRGGEPSQNLVLLDGMTIYQPFHVLGFYSAFPAGMLAKSDIYAGGFGSRYGGRISSVLDVSTRNGNNRSFAGTASISPFVSAAQLEGPIIPGKTSFLVSARESTISQGAAHYVDAPLPFSFGDILAKVNGNPNSRSRFSITGLRTHDSGRITEPAAGSPPDFISWENRALGARLLFLPKLLPVAADFHVSFSSLKSTLGPDLRDEETLRTSEIEGTTAAMDLTFFGNRISGRTGLNVRLISLDSRLGGLYQNIELRRSRVDEIAQYLEMEFDLKNGLKVETGLRMQFYQVRTDPTLEPRLRATFERGVHQLSVAAGIYNQEITGLTDRRDAASVFTVWNKIPREEGRARDIRAGRLPSALHAIVGYRVTPSDYFEASLEGFYKNLDNLFVPEWTAFPRFRTLLQPASGRSLGFDFRAETRLKNAYAAINYGFSQTTYTAEQAALQLWYGEENLDYRPPHDRRHQVNAIGSWTVAGFNLSTRWEFGSGLPFSRVYGYDGFVLVDDIIDVREITGAQRVIYEKPYNGELPTYHRLDISVDRSFTFNKVSVTAQGSIINVYDRRNIFYLDVFTEKRVDQLPFVPSLSLEVSFK